jgi:DNA-binding NarL/FixJ family response regulator
MPIRILIADDDKTIRLLLRRILESHELWEICADASDGKDAIEKAAQLHPDLIVLDLAMPVMNGLQAAERLSKEFPNTPLLLISVQQITNQLEQTARRAGFKGAVTKSSGAEVLTAVEALLRSESFFAIEGSSRVA